MKSRRLTAAAADGRRQIVPAGSLARFNVATAVWVAERRAEQRRHRLAVRAAAAALGSSR